MRFDDYALSILVDEQALDELPDPPAGCSWIVAERGKAFSLLLSNHSDEPIAVLAFVDGLSVTDGQPRNLHSPGYVVRAQRAVVIPGWRVSTSYVARFEFARAEAGYAASVGFSPRNGGVIEAAFFRGRFCDAPPPPQAPPARSTMDKSIDRTYRPKRASLYDSADRRGDKCLKSLDSTMDRHHVPDVPFSIRPELRTMDRTLRRTPAAAETNTDDVAVGFGRRTGHAVTPMYFERIAEEPDALLRIRYDIRAALERRQIGCPVPTGWTGD